MSDREGERPSAALPPLGDASPVTPQTRPYERPGRGRRPESPGALIVVGLGVSAVLGGFLLTAGEAGDVRLMVLLGYLAVVIGSVITSIGVIAAGVRLGLQWSRIDEGR